MHVVANDMPNGETIRLDKAVQLAPSLPTNVTSGSTYPPRAPASVDGDPARAAWARYWRTGALHSCPTSYAGDYQGAIGGFWRARFGELSDGQRVLDVATGNGALPHLLLAERGDVAVDCDAVDLAPVAPDWIRGLKRARRARLHFHAGTAAERLPFEDGRFDLVTSQYGLEYTDLALSVPELLRVTKRPATLALVAHHAGSRPVAMARDELDHLAWLQQPGGLFETARRLLEPMARARTEAGRRSLAGDAAANACRAQFNRLQRELGDRAAGAACPDVLFETREVVAQAMQTAQRHGTVRADALLDTFATGLADNAVRLRDLVRCALDDEGLAALLRRLGPTEAKTVRPLVDAGHLMGWGIVARLRPPD